MVKNHIRQVAGAVHENRLFKLCRNPQNSHKFQFRLQIELSFLTLRKSNSDAAIIRLIRRNH